MVNAVIFEKIITLAQYTANWRGQTSKWKVYEAVFFMFTAGQVTRVIIQYFVHHFDLIKLRKINVE